MKPSGSLCAGFALLLCLVSTSSSLAQVIVVRPAGLDMNVLGRVKGDDGQARVVPIGDDSVLQTGDGVQIRLRVAQDAYVYVIVYGSSESAVVLQPFSGRRGDAFMRAGEERVIPGPDRFLPLDRRAGVESFYVFASPTPVRTLSSLLVRMEARGGDRAAVFDALRSSHAETLALSFRHADAGSTARNKAEISATASPGSEQTAVTSAPPAAAIQRVEEQGVLSAEGSRIQALIGGSTPSQAAEMPQSGAVSQVPKVQSAPAAVTVPKPAPAVKSGGWFGSLFGFGGDAAAKPAAGTVAAEEVVPATTYALPVASSTEVQSVEVTADARNTAAAEMSARAATAPVVAEEDTKRGPETSPTAAEKVDPQLNVSVLDALSASLGATSEPDRRAGESAVATSPASISTAQPAADVSHQVSATEPAPEPQASSTKAAAGGGVFGALGALFTGDQTPGVNTGGGGVAKDPEAPLSTGLVAGATSENQPVQPGPAPDTPAVAESVTQTGTLPDEPAKSSGGFLSLLFGTPEGTELGREQESAPVDPPAEPVAEVGQAAAPTTDTEPPPTGADSGDVGFLSLLFGAPSTPGAGASTSNNSVQAIVEPVSKTPTPSEPESATSANPAPVKNVAIGPAQPPETAPKTVAIGPAVVAPASEPPVDTRPATPSESEVPSQAPAVPEVASDPETGGAGILRGLASLFGGSSVQKIETADSGSQAAAKIDVTSSVTGVLPAAAEPAADDTAKRAAPAQSVIASAPGKEKSAGNVTPPQPASTPPSVETKATTGSADAAAASGLFGGLAGWFSGSSTKSVPQEKAEPPGDPAPSSPVVLTPPKPVEPAPAPVAANEAEKGGFFGGLSRLFGGRAQPEKSTDRTPDEADANVAAAAQTPTATETGTEPAFKTVTRSDGKQVVIVQGPPGRADVPPSTSEVLAAEGSKIRALLAPETPVAPEDNVVAKVRDQAAPSAKPAAEKPVAAEAQQPAAGPALPPSEEVTVTRSLELNTLTASAADPVPARSVSLSPSSTPTARAAAVTPDEVQAALESGAAAARPAAETLAALTAPAPAVEVSVSPVQEIDVTASDNVSSSIVLVVTPTGTGSGVLLDNAGHVLANWHVVNGYSTVSVSFKSPYQGMPSMERTFSARVVRLNKTADLALLRVEVPPGDVSPVRFADASGIKEGDVLHAIGHPASGAWTHTLGKIENVKPESSWYAGRNLLHRGTVIQAKVLDDPGSAGAPLFNNRLELVGISTVARSKKGVITGVSVETIRLFLEAPPAGG